METLEAFSLLQTLPTSIAQVVEAHTVVLQPDGLPPLLFSANLLPHYFVVTIYEYTNF